MKYTFMENFKDKDPEFYDFYSHFIGEEVIDDTTLDDKSRYLSITAVLVGTKSHDLFKDMLEDLMVIAINQGISQVEKEKEENMKSLTGGLDLSSFM